MPILGTAQRLKHAQATRNSVTSARTDGLTLHASTTLPGTPGQGCSASQLWYLQHHAILWGSWLQNPTDHATGCRIRTHNVPTSPRIPEPNNSPVLQNTNMQPSRAAACLHVPFAAAIASTNTISKLAALQHISHRAANTAAHELWMLLLTMQTNHVRCQNYLCSSPTPRE